MTIAKANNASYVTISESPVRMKEIHRHHSFHSSLMKGAKKYCSFHLKEKGATATVVVFLRVSPSREIPFFILRRVSGFVKKKRKNGEGTRATDGRPYGAEFFGGNGCVACHAGDGWSPLWERERNAWGKGSVCSRTTDVFRGNSFFVLKTKGKGGAPALVMRAGL